MTADFPPCVTPAVLAAVHANDRRKTMPDTTTPAVTLVAYLADLSINGKPALSGTALRMARTKAAELDAAERGEADALRAAMHALAETLVAGRHPGSAVDLRDYVTARLRAIAGDQR